MRRYLPLLLAIPVLALPATANGAGDAANAAAYVRADYKLVHELVAELALLRRQPPAVLAEVKRNCPLAGLESPQDPESTLLSDEVIGALVLRSDHAGRVAIGRFLASAGRLRWRADSAGRAARGYVHALGSMIRLPYPPLCSDVRYWASHGFLALSPFTRSFAPRFMNEWVAAGQVPPAVARLERGKIRTLGRRAAALEAMLAEWEANAVETYTAVMNELAIYP